MKRAFPLSVLLLPLFLLSGAALHGQTAAGLSLRAELNMPIFSVNVGIGRNLIQQGEDTRGFYQILALKAFVTHRLFLHVGYQLHDFKDPNNLMLGLGWRFGKF